MDEVENFFAACYDDRFDDVVIRLRNDPGFIHSRRISGRTPLHQAAFGGALRVATLLIENGADVNAVTDYVSPFCVLGGKIDCVAPAETSHVRP
jgi:ankyrin repeat protein